MGILFCNSYNGSSQKFDLKNKSEQGNEVADSKMYKTISLITLITQ